MKNIPIEFTSEKTTFFTRLDKTTRNRVKINNWYNLAAVGDQYENKKNMSVNRMTTPVNPLMTCVLRS